MKKQEEILAKNNHKLESFDDLLDKKYGAPGSESRAQFEEKAYAFFFGKEIEDARKQVKWTQSELAEKVGTSKTYISRIENGHIDPKVSTLYRIMSALGYRISFSLI